MTDARFLDDGVGFAVHSDGDVSKAVLAYQVMFGVGYDLTDDVEVQGGYRFLGTGAYEEAGVELSYSTHNFDFGLLYRF